MTQALKPGWRIVVIDASADDRAEAMRLLREGSQRRCEFVEAASGAAGVRAVLDAAGAPDCVLLDDRLPDMAVAQALAGLASPEGAAVCPVLVLSGSATAGASGLLRAGAQEHLGKAGLSAPALVRAVENAAERWGMARELHARLAEWARCAGGDAFRLALVAATRPLADPRAIKDVAARALGQHLRASRVMYVEARPNGELLIEQGYVDGVAPISGHDHIDDFGSHLRARFEARHNVVCADLRNDAAFSALEKSRYAGLDVAALLAVPLLKGGRLVAILCVHQNRPREFTSNEIALAQHTAECTWEAVERARTEQQLRDQSRELQDTLVRERAARAEAQTQASLRRHEAAVPPLAAIPTRWQALQGGWVGYAAGLAWVAAAVLLRWSVDDVLGPAGPFALTWLALIPAAFFLPALPFAVAAVAGLVASDLLFLDSRGELNLLDSPGAAIQSLAFIGMAFGLGFLARRARVGEQRARTEAAAGRAAAAALRESEQRFAQAIDAAKAGTWALYPGTRNFSASPRTLELHQLPAGIHPGYAAALACIHPSDRSRVKVATGRAIAHAQPYSIEYRVPLHDGSDRWLLSHAEAHPGPNGVRLVGMVQDVTEARAAAAALRESEEQFRRAIEDAPLPVIMHAEDGRVLQLSKAWTALTGYAPAEVPTFDDWVDKAYGKQGDAVRARVRDLFAGRTAFTNSEREIRTRSGAMRTWNLSASSPGVLRDGRRYIVAMALDVTERKLAEAAVAASQAQLAQLIQLMPSFTAVLRGPNHVFQLANEPYYALVGRGPEIIGRPLIEALPELADQQAFKLIDRVYRSGEPFEAKGQAMILARGTGRALNQSFVDFAYVALRQADGSVGGVLMHGVDRTVQIRAEQALRRREQELQTLADNTPQMLSRLDRQLRHVFVNAAVERATGRSRNDFLGRTNRELGFPAPLCKLWDGALRSVFDTAKPGSISYAYESSAGLRHYDARLVPEFAADGTVEFVLAVVHDVTRRKRFEQALVDQDRRKDEFLATLAHELRNPLAPIRNGLTILHMLGVPQPGLKTLAMMDRQLDHLVHLVDDLLDISRVSRGKITLRIGRVTAREIVEAAIESCRPLIDAREHTLVAELPDEPLSINGDRTRLVQMVQNLLTNAAKYSEAGGRIVVTVARESDNVVVRVADTGVGIAADTLPTLWDMFSQVRDTLDKAQGGLGIGLSLVKKLIELHGGSVTGESPGLGLGSTFTLRLPLAAPIADDAHTVAARAGREAQPGPGRSVLVVDDNADGADSLAEIVGLFGHRAVTAYDGPAALGLALALSPDIVFLDIGLPGMDGYEVARRLRAHELTARVVLVAVTGWGTDDDKRRAREAGFDFHLTKPVDLAAVQRVLDEPAALRRMLRQRIA